MQLNRRYINGLQFAVAYTFGKTDSDGTNGNPPASIRSGRRRLERGPGDVDAAAQPGHQLHLGRAEREHDVEQRADARPARRLAAVRRHRRSSAATGPVGQPATRRRPTTSTSPAATWRSAQRQSANGSAPAATAIRPRTARGSYFDVSAFSRPSGRGDIGNAPATFYRLPKIVLSNMSIFKNFQLGGGKRIQFRWEAYNVFNQVNW